MLVIGGGVAAVGGEVALAVVRRRQRVGHPLGQAGRLFYPGCGHLLLGRTSGNVRGWYDPES